MRLSSAEFIKRYDKLVDQVQHEPITVTKDDQDRFVVLSVSDYRRLLRGDRRVITAGEFTDEELALIAAAEAPPDYDYEDTGLVDAKS